MADTTQIPWYKQTLHRSTYSLSFNTPAFLGDAEQFGGWRTPPIKALLRFWWRIASWPAMEGDIARLREAEKALFGGIGQNGEEKNAAQRSLVQLRLEPWEDGKLTIDNTLQSYSYLGYGPLGTDTEGSKEQTKDTRTRNAITPGSRHTKLIITHPADIDLTPTLQLIQWFGTLGSRSANGWGSLHIEELQTAVSPLPVESNLKACFSHNWPHTIGYDDTGLLIWKTPVRPSWEQAMKQLAQIKKSIRTKAKGEADGDDVTHFRSEPQKDQTAAGVHLLGYPVGDKPKKGKHLPTWKLAEWPDDARITSQLRFKVIRQHHNGKDQYYGLIYHLPHSLPIEQPWLQANQLSIWQALHKELDSNTQLNVQRFTPTQQGAQ
ncbi:hypothetical protein QCD60_02560 [Pokkaliibacter sp. MBI-7]|uniref:RAMP superfamily CRISPR-associated protein n=1 Tax=Pokkaliibacter sp. MBI-7 TaxID=3040600 RepID=UPI0024487FD3|nr:RAMP superfamily CRISPR-associated protein [Pokkaliibacter sp. MBI-7]MDH2431439.1 hypothetical protein [Pokkaliibacter sp. MBI-7]